MKLNRRLLTDALAEAGIDHVLFDRSPERVRVWISDEAWAKLPQALASSGAWYCNVLGKPTLVAHISRLPSPSIVFLVWASPGGEYLGGSDFGVELFSGPKPARENTEPPVIDFVFTWVDGEDPAWQERQRARKERTAGARLHETATNRARYASFNELKYALRAIELYAPWHHQIYLVTDNQRPSWLLDQPGLTVIDHREIFEDPSDLPTFNSHAIESRLHHIPGLAEHYVYFNDDVFLGRYTPPSIFYDERGHPRVFLADEEIPDVPIQLEDEPVASAAKNNRHVLQSLTGYRLTHKMKHVPHPQLRSLAFELEERSPDALAKTASAPFRSPADLSVASSLVPHFALATSRGTPGKVAHFYSDVASPELRWRLPHLLEHRDAEIICLNATTLSASAGNTKRTLRFLERYFPAASGFERSTRQLGAGPYHPR